MEKTYQQEIQWSSQDPQGFWQKKAKEIEWFTPPHTVLEQDEQGQYRWFGGGKLNTSYLALDKHIKDGRGEQAAIIYDSPVTGKKEKYTYNQVLDQVAQLAGGLLELGVTKGDRVIIYLPMIPEAVFSMLACARIGAIHSVVFGGFAAHELAIRIDDAKPKAIITANYGIEVDRYIPYKPIIDEAKREASTPPEHTIILDRGNEVPFELLEGELDYRTLVNRSAPAAHLVLDAHDPLYILYTSGTTGKPKGIIRDNGGHAVALKYSMATVYGCEAGDVFWAASDVGWVVGHSYIVYAPLIHGCTTILFEGKPIRTPDASTFWRIISEHRVKVMFTAPTAIRAIRKEDPEGAWIRKYDLSSLKTQFLAGERCDASTLNWLREQLQVPVVDHWWQTESGWPMLGNCVGLGMVEVKPGSVTRPVPGYQVEILNEAGDPCLSNEEGFVCVKLPLPPGCLPSLYNDPERFRRGYLEPIDGYYFTGDGGYVDEDGYYFITGRVDDVINVAGHRLSTAEMEEEVAAHPGVTECAVIGVFCEIKGQVPLALIVVRDQERYDLADLEQEIRARVRARIGAIASLKHVIVAPGLPKTRSGKILRKTMRAIAAGQAYKVPSTIEDVGALTNIETLLSDAGIV